MTSKEVEARHRMDVEAALLDGVALPEIEDPEKVTRSIIERILTAEDADAVLAPFEVVHGKELLNVPLEIHGVRWQRSGLEGGAPVYAVLDATRLDTGERMTATTSGRTVMAALLRFDQLEAWPQMLKLVEAANPTAEGYRPLKLVRP